jgi:large subunit ribosomal protein L28
MSRRCQITGKKNNTARNVSNSNRHTQKIQKANIQTKKFYIPELDRWVKLRLSTRALRTLNKKPLKAFLKDNNMTYKDLGIEV